MEDRWRVVNCMKDGMSPTAIKKKYGHNRPFIYRWWKRYQGQEEWTIPQGLVAPSPYP